MQRLRVWLPVIGLIAGASCTAPVDVTNPTRAITLVIAPLGASVGQGGIGQVTATVTGTGGFVGATTVTVEGLPAGVSADVTITQTTPTIATALVTLTVAGTASAGSYTVTLRGHGTGVVDATAVFALTITTVQTFSLTVGPAIGLNIAQGFGANGTINVSRAAGFTGSVSFAVSGLPSGLTLEPAPTSTTGTSATFGLAASLNVVPGTYLVTFHGTATGVAEQTATLTVVIGAAGTGNAVLDFSACAATSKPIWLATQDGTGGWSRTTSTSDAYRFNVNAAIGQAAWVTSSGANAFTIHELIRLHDVLVATPLLVCGAPGIKTINGTLANLGAGLAAKVYLGGSGVTRNANGAFQLTAVPDGNLDLVAYQRNVASPGIGDRMLLRRGQNIATDGTLGMVDLTGTESFVPVPATMTAIGATAGESVGYSMEYFTGSGLNGCQLAVLYGDNPAGPAFTAYGVPPAQQVAGDFHAIAFNASENATGAVRTIIQYFHTMTATTVMLPSALPVPVFSVPNGPYRRLQATFTMPADYSGTAQLQYGDPTGPSRFVIVTADGGAFATQGGVLALQDFSGVSGWSNSWGPTATTSNWSLTGISTQPASACQDGARLAFSQRFGTF